MLLPCVADPTGWLPAVGMSTPLDCVSFHLPFLKRPAVPEVEAVVRRPDDVLWHRKLVGLLPIVLLLLAVPCA